MSVTLRAQDEPARTRPDYWRAVVNRTLAPMEIDFDDADNLDDTLISGDLGAVRVTESFTGAGRARRTAKHIRGSESDAFQLIVQVHGRVVGEQRDRQTVLDAGDLSLIDLSQPFRCIHQACHTIFVTFPHALTPLRPQEAQLVGTRIPGDRGPGALVADLVRQLPSHLGEDHGATGARLGTAVVDLLTAALTPADRRSSARPGTRENALLLRINAFVESRLSDPDLSPAEIAAAHHISVRYLHKLFAAQGQTVASMVRQRRLERCRRDLLDPVLADRPVHATAMRWGFATAAHFNRLFRQTYGLPPGEFRKAHLQLPDVSHRVAAGQ